MSQASYKSMLVKHMQELYRKGLQTDIRVIVNDRENILLHSVVVGHHSEFFATSSLTPVGVGADLVKVVALKDVDVGVFRRIIGWMYTSEIEISDAGDAIALFELATLEVASVLRIGDLELLCAEYFEEADLKRDCLGYWEFGNRMRSDRLQQRVSVFVARKLRLLCNTWNSCGELTDFMTRLSSQEAVAELLNMDALCVYLVVDLFFLWIGKHADQDAGSLMRRLRLDRLPLACIERLSGEQRLHTAVPLLKQCIASRRVMLKDRPAPVLFVGMFPPSDDDEDDGEPRSWEKVVRFDLDDKTTTRLLDIPCKLGDAKCVAVYDSVFLFGSDDNTIFMYLNEQWHPAGYIPSTWSSTWDLSLMSATATGRHVFFVGEITVTFDTSDGKWYELPSMNVPRIMCTSASIGDRVFVFGGKRKPQREHGTVSEFVPIVPIYNHPCQEDEVFDMNTLKWTNLPTSIRRFDCTSVAVDCQIYIIGGTTSFGLCTDGPDETVRTVQSYCVTTNTMIQHADMYKKRSLSIGRFFVSATHKGIVHVFSEKFSRRNAFTERFEIESGRWTQCSKAENDEFYGALSETARTVIGEAALARRLG